MIVPGGSFIAAVATLKHPSEEFRKPPLKVLLIRFGPRLRASQQTYRINHSCQSASFDQANAAAGVHAGDELRKLEIRIHTRRGFYKPGSQQLCGFRRIRFIATEKICK